MLVTGDYQGAVWMGGAAPVIDSHGDVWVSTGNGSVHSDTNPYDDSDAALDLTPTMQLRQFFSPVTWAQDNASDYDMTTAPVLLSSGQVILAGKSPRVYLLTARTSAASATLKRSPRACATTSSMGVAPSSDRPCICRV